MLVVDEGSVIKFFFFFLFFFPFPPFFIPGHHRPLIDRDRWCWHTPPTSPERAPCSPHAFKYAAHCRSSLVVSCNADVVIVIRDDVKLAQWVRARDCFPEVVGSSPAKTQKIENSHLHGFELHRPSSKGTKLLLQVIKAIINQYTWKELVRRRSPRNMRSLHSACS